MKVSRAIVTWEGERIRKVENGARGKKEKSLRDTHAVEEERPETAAARAVRSLHHVRHWCFGSNRQSCGVAVSDVVRLLEGMKTNISNLGDLVYQRVSAAR